MGYTGSSRVPTKDSPRILSRNARMGLKNFFGDYVPQTKRQLHPNLPNRGIVHMGFPKIRSTF